MTIKEFFESKDKIAIHCDTSEQFDRLRTAFEDNGYECRTEKSSTETTNQYGPIYWYEHNGFKVLDFDDIEL